jgi:glucarate dehydratase
VTPEGRIREVVVTPVAHPEPPLLFCGGLHQPEGVRSIVEVRCDDGLTGVGESYGDERFVGLLTAVAPHLVGVDVADAATLAARVTAALAGRPALAGYGAPGAPSTAKTARSVLAPLEVACLDAQGRLLGRPVAELLGGRRRDEVPFAAYLFHRWDRHPGLPADDWGAALDADGIVAQARTMVERYGFRSLKLKGGVLPPEAELAELAALREALPGRPLRLDPNAAWTVPTSLALVDRVGPLLEYLEDPTASVAGMAEVQRRAAVPLATNMCVVGPEDLPAATAQRAVSIVLGDLHYWGGLRASLDLAARCAADGLGMSMHSSAHLGVTLATMLQLGAALPTLEYAFDTHWPWHGDDVLAPGTFAFVDGSVAVPTGPGLGVDLDRDALARMHERWRRSPYRRQDHEGHLRQFQPGFRPNVGRW